MTASKPNVRYDPVPIGSAARSANDIAKKLHKLVADVAPASRRAVRNGGLNIGPTLGAVSPEWESHLKAMAGEVGDLKWRLEAAGGGLVEADWKAAVGIHDAVTPI